MPDQTPNPENTQEGQNPPSRTQSEQSAALSTPAATESVRISVPGGGEITASYPAIATDQATAVQAIAENVSAPASPNVMNVTDISAQGDASANFGGELASINFDALIAGPLIAAIRAQGIAATQTLDFINNVAFNSGAQGKGDGKTLTTATFSYPAIDPKTGLQNGTTQLVVPFITMVPVPFIRIEQMTIDFAVKLNQVTASDNTNTNSLHVSGGYSSLLSPWSVSVTNQNTNVNTQKNDVTRDYSMNVRVIAVQDSMPAGLSKVLDIFNSVVTAQSHPPAPAPSGK